MPLSEWFVRADVRITRVMARHGVGALLRGGALVADPPARK